LRLRPSRMSWLTQELEFAAKFVQHGFETHDCRLISGLYFTEGAEGLDDQVDRPIVHVQAVAVGKHSDLRARFHFFAAFPDASGHGLSARGTTRRRPSSSLLLWIEFSGRT